VATPVLLPLVAAGLLTAGAIAVAVRSVLEQRKIQAQVDATRAELARVEAQNREQTRHAVRLRTEQRGLTNVVRFLPNLVRELNQSDLDPRRIPSLLFQLADAIFEPEQMLLYETRSPGDDMHPPELYLREQRGLAEVPASLKRVPVGEGKIGWVAENRVEMSTEDWLNLTRTEGRSLVDNHPTTKLELVGPLVQHDEEGERLLGVLCIGGLATRSRDEKLMLQMVTNLGAIAYTNARNLFRLRDQANKDGLTRLLNKRFFMQRLGLLINSAEREARPLSIFIFDIDHFKTYNDTQGHLAGDEVLRSVARVLEQSLRPGDIPSRYGGEEFLVAMPDTDKVDALRAADRIRDAIASHPFPHAASQPLGRLTISGGVAALRLDGMDSSELIRHADQALYQAKAGGRNRVLPYRGIEIGGDGKDLDLCDRPPGSDAAMER
jgi:diguanylate cyclase (GGDEF)-like protein